MIKEPLISIVMPAYNAGHTIEEAIRSVIAQTYTNWELIVIDDCSSDNTFSVAEYLAMTDRRIRLLKNARNAGVSATRNIAVTVANGAWIAFLDSDDMWASDKLHKQMALLNNKPDASLIFTGSAFVNAENRMASYHLHVPEHITYRQLLKQNLISCSSVLVKKDLMDEYPMKYDNMHEDYAVWLQILKGGHLAYGIDEPLLIYRLSGTSKSSDKKRAAGMTFRVYRFIGLNYIQALYYFCWYAVKNLKKYRSIRTGLR